jgi:hypothetical protein
MKYALISPEECLDLPDGVRLFRIAQVESDPFDVALPLHWVECEDHIVADVFGWDGEKPVLVPVTPPQPDEPSQQEPTPSSGSLPVSVL